MSCVSTLTAWRLAGAAAAGALALGVAACSNPVTDRIGDATDGLADRLRLSGGGQGSNEPIPPAPRPDTRACPSAVIRDGTQTLRIYETGGEGDPDFVRYQGSITKVARECVYAGDEILTVKFGVQGRVVIGPRGQAGTYSVPVRAVFVARGSEPIWGQLYQVTVTVPEGGSSGTFQLIEQTAAYTIPPGADLANHAVYVGFDELSAQQ